VFAPIFTQFFFFCFTPYFSSCVSQNIGAILFERARESSNQSDDWRWKAGEVYVLTALPKEFVRSSCLPYDNSNMILSMSDFIGKYESDIHGVNP
jgi:hypothetical protein